MTVTTLQTVTRTVYRSILRQCRHKKPSRSTKTTLNKPIYNLHLLDRPQQLLKYAVSEDEDEDEDGQEDTPSPPPDTPSPLLQVLSSPKPHRVIKELLRSGPAIAAPAKDLIAHLLQVHRNVVNVKPVLQPELPLPNELPIFTLNSTALPGEIVELIFFEPRYRHMMQRIIEGDRLFLLQFKNIKDSDEDSVTTILLKVLQNTPTDLQQVHTSCLAGVRVSVGQERLEKVEGQAEPLHWARDIEIVRDTVPTSEEEEQQLLNLREFCLSLFVEEAGTNTTFLNAAVPSFPPQDPELFSFWLLQVLYLPPLSLDEKFQVLQSRCTLERFRIWCQCVQRQEKSWKEFLRIS